MKLRLTLIALALFAFAALVVGAVQYYQNLKANVIAHAETRMASETLAIANQIETFLNGNILADRALAGLERIRGAVRHPIPSGRAAADRTLGVFQKGLRASVCYIMDRHGVTVASSNHNSPGSFVGKNYGFRPYFKAAMAGKSAIYLAKGVTSGKRGIYYSEPIRDPSGRPVGAAVVKTDIARLELKIPGEKGGGWLIASPNDLIFATNRSDWRYRFLWKPTPVQRQTLAQSRQFGLGSWQWSGLTRIDGRRVEDRLGHRFYYSRVPFTALPGWFLYNFRPEDEILSPISVPFLDHRKIVAFMASLFGSAFILILYLMARGDIVRRKRVNEALRQKNEYLGTLHEISLGMHGRLDFQEIVKTILSRAGLLTGTPHGFFYFYDAERDGLELRVGLGEFQGRIGAWTKPGQGFAGEVYAGGRPLYLTDGVPGKGEGGAPCFAGLQALMGTPLTVRGRILGVMGLGFEDRKESFGDKEREILGRFSEFATIALENARLYTTLQTELAERQRAQVALKEANETLKRMVLIDGLTQIANRRCFDQHLTGEWRRMIRAKQPLGLLLCDVDHFKNFNDAYGHQAGDDCLRRIAETIAGLVQREGDLVARYGGEEFAVILSGADREGALRVAERMRQAVAEMGIPHAQNADKGIVTISIGVAATYPDVQTPLASLLEAADRSLYRAKSGGRNQVVAESVDEGSPTRAVETVPD